MAKILIVDDDGETRQLGPVPDGDGYTAALEREVRERKRAEAVLAQRTRLAELRTEVGLALSRGDTLRAMLHGCATAVLHHLDGAFTGIWTVRPEDRVWELQAHAGAYLHPEDPHTRGPLAESQVPDLAATRGPWISHDIQNGPCPLDRSWAGREGLVAFAGYPLAAAGQTVGFLALATRRPLDELTLNVLSLIADMTALAIQRWRAEGEARETHAENERLLASISSILIGLDGQMRIRKWNRVAEEVLGVPAADVLGRPFDAAGLPWVDERVLESLRECHRRQQKIFLDDIAFTRVDGRRGYLGLSATPIPKGEGVVPGTLLLGADLTERRLLEAQLTQAQRLESIGQLAAGIAHEINTPIQYVGDNAIFLRDSFRDLLQAVEAYAAYFAAAKQGAVPPERTAELEDLAARLDIPYLCEEIPLAIQQTLQGVESVAKIVRAMKEFSHPGGEAKVASDLNHAIENTIVVSRNEWKYVAELVTDFDTSLPPVYCYPDEFNQVILNLIINAAHAIEERRRADTDPKGTITVRTRRLGDRVQVQVRDTGCGIPEAIRPRIFDPFFTTKPIGKGTGQGLALAHAIVVRRHGGTIDFESQVGEGTTFTVTLVVAGDAGGTAGRRGSRPPFATAGGVP